MHKRLAPVRVLGLYLIDAHARETLRYRVFTQSCKREVLHVVYGARVSYRMRSAQK